MGFLLFEIVFLLIVVMAGTWWAARWWMERNYDDMTAPYAAAMQRLDDLEEVEARHLALMEEVRATRAEVAELTTLVHRLSSGVSAPAPPDDPAPDDEEGEVPEPVSADPVEPSEESPEDGVEASAPTSVGSSSLEMAWQTSGWTASPSPLVVVSHPPQSPRSN